MNTRYALLALFLLLAVGCAPSNRLADYDFHDRTVAVYTEMPAHPDVLSESWLSFDDDNDGGLVSLLFEVGSVIAKDVSADKARRRLDDAAAQVDVAALLNDRVAEGALRTLRARPAADEYDADYVLDVRITHYGIVASSWHAQAHFKVVADVWLLDQEGRRVWRKKVKQKDPIGPNTWFLGQTVSNVVTADALARLSTEEMVVALESLASYAGDRIVYSLRHDLERARR